MGLFGNKNTLEIPGIGAGVSQEQMNMFASAAQQSGLQDYGMQMVNQWTGGGLDTEQIELIYHMIARHPNEMDIFLAQSPGFLIGLAELISIIIKKELYAWFNSPVIPSTINAEEAANLGYSTITQENIDTILNKMVQGTDPSGVITTPQQRINSADAESAAVLNQYKFGHQMGMMNNQMGMMNNQMGMMNNQMGNQQQQWQQQQWQQQQLMQQQQQGGGLSGALGAFGSSLIRGSLGLPPAGMYGAQQGMYPQQNMLPQQGMNGGSGQTA
jgi:hypothetical protein